jgi:glycosyltransferase involved in cell wall biosynthesis
MNNILFIEENKDGTVGGSHKCLLYLVQYINKDRFTPVVLFYQANAWVELFKRYAKTHIIDFRNYYKRGPIYFRKCVNTMIHLNSIIRCISFIKRNRINLVHLNNTVSSSYDQWLIAAKILKVPCVTHERNYIKRHIKDSFLQQLLCNRFDKIFAVSNFIRNNLINKGIVPDKIVTIYDGIDAFEYKQQIKKTRTEIEKEISLPPNTFLIGHVGNIRKWKGQELLIDGLNILQGKLPNFYCLFIGDTEKSFSADWEYKNGLLQKIESFHLQNKICFTGFRDDVPDLINALDLQINSSIEPDPFPHVILEGLALGKIIVASDLGGAVESISNGKDGFTFSPGDPHSLAAIMYNALTDNEMRQRISAAAIKKADAFNMKNTICQIEVEYSRLLKICM